MNSKLNVDKNDQVVKPTKSFAGEPTHIVEVHHPRRGRPIVQVVQPITRLQPLTPLVPAVQSEASSASKSSILADGSTIRLKVSPGCFLGVQEDGSVVTTMSKSSPGTVFQVRERGEGKISLVSPVAKFVRIHANGCVDAKGGGGRWTLFSVETSGARVSLQSCAISERPVFLGQTDEQPKPSFRVMTIDDAVVLDQEKKKKTASKSNNNNNKKEKKEKKADEVASAAAAVCVAAAAEAVGDAPRQKLTHDERMAKRAAKEAAAAERQALKAKRLAEKEERLAGRPAHAGHHGRPAHAGHHGRPAHAHPRHADREARLAEKEARLEAKKARIANKEAKLQLKRERAAVSLPEGEVIRFKRGHLKVFKNQDQDMVLVVKIRGH